MNKSAKDTFHVLIADDSADDRYLLKEALKQAGRLKLVAEVADGHEAIAYLSGHSGFGDRKKFPLPDLLLLDLKMPLKDGFAVLEWLKARSMKNFTVVVLTDSVQAEYIKRALDLGADLFQVKPKAHQDRQVMILALEEYLLKAAGRAQEVGYRLAQPAI